MATGKAMVKQVGNRATCLELGMAVLAVCYGFGNGCVALLSHSGTRQGSLDGTQDS